MDEATCLPGLQPGYACCRARRCAPEPAYGFSESAGGGRAPFGINL